jgi:alkanesulfonate monooxygenase SsuD/methylene tetrahydromethanopterin reductase-like flavin-dependent oxidoreductase (luciferase family)
MTSQAAIEKGAQMQVGMLTFWQHAVPGVDDPQFVREELEMAELAEELGFDFLGIPEHHFEDYSMSADNIQLLSYVAGRTSRIGLLTSVVVLPWHDPIRVAEKMILLDYLSNGRALFGMGRGLAPREYAAFGIPQEEARERFDEMAEMIVRALETGVIEGDGPFYPTKPLVLRPRPLKSMKDRLFAVANSPSSAKEAARLGARLTMFVAQQLDTITPTIDLYRETWRETHGTEPLPPLLNDFTFCTRDPALAERARTEWYPKYWQLTLDHYQLEEVDYSQIKGYEAHSEKYEVRRDTAAATQIWGTPEEMLAKWRNRLDVVGDAIASFTFRWGGMPADATEQSIRLFVAEVLPELRRLGARVSSAA